MSDRYFNRSRKYKIEFDLNRTEAKLLACSKKQTIPTTVKVFHLEEAEFTPDKYHREKQLCKHVLGYLIKERKMTMRELNEYALKAKLITPVELMLDTATTKL